MPDIRVINLLLSVRAVGISVGNNITASNLDLVRSVLRLRTVHLFKYAPTHKVSKNFLVLDNSATAPAKYIVFRWLHLIMEYKSQAVIIVVTADSSGITRKVYY